MLTNSNKQFVCDLCNAGFCHQSSRARHRKKCIERIKQRTEPTNENIDPSNFALTPEHVLELIKSNHELQNLILVQHQTLNDIVKNGVNNNYSHNNHSNNKTFNLQFFLNETCKDAMNLMEFVDSIQLQLSDIEKLGKIGYVQGITDIITRNLKSLEVTQRPVHCTDKKREIMYVKESNKWDKEDDNYTLLRKAVKRVSNRNIPLLSIFREKHPDYCNSSARISDIYDHIVVEVMGGFGNNTEEKENKIIRNISRCVTIDKKKF